MAMNDERRLSTTNVVNFGLVKNCRNPTTLGFALCHKPNGLRCTKLAIH